jgi:ssDNA-binding Zn-finger/Zn-ribbon topoisomerase 1
MSDHINELYDKDGNLVGALLTAEAWAVVRDQVMSALGVVETPVEQERPEPISEWETLKEYWDFQYPVDVDVACENCGNSTEDWTADDPRLFRLTSANLAGLVAFTCTQCRAKITKRHFKDQVTTECAPYRDSKITSKEGRY